VFSSPPVLKTYCISLLRYETMIHRIRRKAVVNQKSEQCCAP
jgi:hypothetical protein